MTGTIVTFYSFKGGVGRSFAVANIGVILSQWGYRTLLVDFDIEAPGLNHYFSNLLDFEAAGVIGFIDDVQSGRSDNWEKYATPIGLEGVDERKLWLMPAVAPSRAGYAETVQHLDWDSLYDKSDFGSRIELIRQQWTATFDFVLIDSRTGVTDFSGLTTAQLPDVLAFLFTPNQQSLAGSCDIARKAMDTRRQLPLDRPAIIPLPIPSKFDQTEEYDRAQFWKRRFAEETKKFYSCWAPPASDLPKLVDLLSIPYVPRWSFGEELATAYEVASPSGTRSPSHPASFALETIAALLANGFDKAQLLMSSRDEYVLTARARAEEKSAPPERDLRVFLSYSHEDRSIAAEVEKALESAGFDTFFAHNDLRPGDNWQMEIERRLLAADAMVALVSSSEARYQRIETETFLRSACGRPVCRIFTGLRLTLQRTFALRLSR
jgi:cellulose biosynthesis protein BcsQ